MVADRFPAMLGSDTFTTVVSSTTMNVPARTERLISHGWTAARSGAVASAIVLPDHHRGHDRHAGPQQVLGVLSFLEHDLHRDPLHDLHVVAGGVFGRQQAEPRPGRGRDAVHVPLV